MSTSGGHGYGSVDPETAKAIKAAKMNKLDETLSAYNDLKAKQNHVLADMHDLEMELGLAPTVDLTGSTPTASVLGMPIHQFTKATFNDTSLIPSKFTGKRLGIDSLNRWLEQFNKYTKFKEMDDTTKFEFFKLLMVDEAADWAAGLDDVHLNFEELFELFRERFLLTDIQKWQQARSVWQRQQKPNESVDEYITWVKTRAKNLPEIGEGQLVYIVISGLRKDIRADVLKAKHDTIEDVTKIARISEIAARETNDGSTTIADLEKTIASLVDKLDQKIVTSPHATQEVAQPEAYSATGDIFIEQQERAEQRRQERRDFAPRRDERSRDDRSRDVRPRFDNRSPMPARRTTWQQSSSYNARPNSPFRSQSPFRQPQQFTQNRQTFNGRTNYRQTQPNAWTPRMQLPSTDRRNFDNNNNGCSNCGRQHMQGQCYAYGQECHNCKKRGHFARLCRSRNLNNSH
jgi:hypothetical protein